jgi:hypothetical protein
MPESSSLSIARTKNAAKLVLCGVNSKRRYCQP